MRHVKLTWQVTLKHNPSPDPRLDPAHADHAAPAALREGSRAIFLGTAYFGCPATILPPLQVISSPPYSLQAVLRCYQKQHSACSALLPEPRVAILGHS